MRIAALILAALILTVATPSEGAISFDMNSWGKPVHQWWIEPDGRIRYRTSVSESGKPFGDYRLVMRETRPSPRRYRWIADLLKPAREWAGKDLHCRLGITDLPYGHLHWDENTAVSFNAGYVCLDASAKQAIALIYRADAQITAWAKDAPITASEVHVESR